ncbi:acetyltransferase, GNAT family [Gottschalkia purinilytica]|uniref:Acetyltransferase, GNAT family n=1 Tax=Gottschalkia purinilytica TaxID=1503 RepID=A0A0L0WAK0_GOTPU|nr:GNAT family N-acetyltransferase [Gottschalkia purinilytica]KNF08350.1 acetyltransferase, GNAT family [Gottschalkia purinilytica]
MIYIETERLILRDWKQSDLEEFRKINSDEVVMEYFPKTLSEQETDAMYEAIQKEFEEYNYGLYAVEVKENKEFIGLIGFHRATFDSDFTPCVEIGWRLKKEAWGKGYATEGAKACLKYGFEQLGFEEIYSFTAKINTRSQNVMKKLGMNYVKDFNHPKVESDSVLYKHVLYNIRA